ncbi:hypothetical protein B0T16DRAFT_335285 [Cercophora newfieldiana]|uniref:Uncharacterized protein n=1 Tax=Cercophora newfieldiana TaxID=92897 RepID=A0AA40CKC6_9PEZI|nr:hypothetical protein B0T16DRAFT_335285 [Cercophora newfieldiana]
MEIPRVKVPRESDWLSAPGEYQDIVSTLCASDPRLRSRCSKNIRQNIPWPNPNARLVVLENDGRGDEGKPFKSPVEHAPKSLRGYLDDHPTPQPGHGRVFILEGLNSDFIAVLGAHFKMHPSLFIDQERTVVISPHSQQSSDFFTLPGTARSAPHFTMKYFEVVSLPQEVLSFRMCCAETGRHIGMTRIKGELLKEGVVRRKCTIWNQGYSDGRWDCLMLVDPPLRAVMTSQNTGYAASSPTYTPRKMVPIASQLFQNGYLDFVPYRVQMTARKGPSRTSMLDDLCFYLQTHPLKDPNPASTFAKKIIASHYHQLFNFTRSVTSDVQFHMSRLDRLGLDHFDTTFVESGQWSDAQALERRISEYHADIESIMLASGIPLADQPDVVGCIASSGSTPWYDCTADFQLLRLRFADVRRHAELLNTAITGLTSISGNQKALREARSTKALTLVGLVFIPLAYTATLFSMTESFGPGGERFWVYFAVSVPLIVCVLGGYTVLDRYGDGVLEWKRVRALGSGVGRTS